MYSCINGATTMPYSLEEDLTVAAQAGFKAVEIWSRKLDLYLDTHEVEELKSQLDLHNLKVASLCPYSLIGFSDQAESLEMIVKAASVAAEISCPILLVCADSPPPNLDRGEAYRIMADVTRRYADLAADYGITIAIEPLGRHPFIPGPREALEVIERAGNSNLSLMIDTFHYYKSGITLQEVEAIPVELISIVHVNDSEDLPLGELTDQNRLYMGDGVIPLKEIMKILKRKKYCGAISVEIFRQAYWQDNPLKIAQKSKAAYDKIVTD